MALHTFHLAIFLIVAVASVAFTSAVGAYINRRMALRGVAVRRSQDSIRRR